MIGGYREVLYLEINVSIVVCDTQSPGVAECKKSAKDTGVPKRKNKHEAHLNNYA